jgi:hypothetical protein
LATGAADSVAREGNESVLYGFANWERRDADEPIVQQALQTAVRERGEERNVDGIDIYCSNDFVWWSSYSK